MKDSEIIKIDMKYVIKQFSIKPEPYNGNRSKNNREN